MYAKIKQVFELTEEILSAAETSDWPAVETLQRQREQLMQQTETLPAPQNQEASEQLSALVNNIQALDARILPLLLKQKQSIIEETQKNNKGRKMNKAYQDNR
ncbi:flagellar protein FliT [uncultured Amphritea sp.]|uniref:flagellar protein FliT n=1 Tax=uncultured Amphritea sp. TaxID=981605 RepID=UPI00261F64FE|nr:flagellar protein FliT [uncultured Amphritea sp.]